MIDAHCHLNFHAFEDDVEDVIKSAQKAGVTTIVNAGTQISSSQWAVDLAEKYEGLLAIVGVHPHHADKVEKNLLEELSKLADNPKVIGIGEIGLDYYSYKSNGIVDPKIQEKIFREQIELAIEKNLPLQIHNRHAGSDVIKILKDYKNQLQNPPGMFHCFAGDFTVLQDALDLGFYLGFDGNSTYKGLAPGETVTLPDLIKATPVDRILTETDSPYLTPIPLRGTRNVPENVIIVTRFIADLKDCELKAFEKIIHTNFTTCFSL